MNPPNAESSINFGLAFVPRLMRPDKSAWVGHLPFAASLVHALRPRQVVELGTHWGDSFFTFCQAALELKLDCQCHAVDTWHGDPQAGQYGEEVYQFVEDHGKKYYPEMSSLLRKSFDEAVQGYDDGSIDLLHIDGLHIYDAVRHDFDAWYSKVRPGGIILFHDIAVRNDDFGVWRLWEEITKRYDECFSFSHCFGLGVLRKSDGNDGGPFFKKLFQGRCDLEIGDFLRAIFDQTSNLKILGNAFLEREKSLEVIRQRLIEIQGNIDTHYDHLVHNFESLLTSTEIKIAGLEQQISRQQDQIRQAQFIIERKDKQIQILTNETNEQRQYIQNLNQSINSLAIRYSRLSFLASQLQANPIKQGSYLQRINRAIRLRFEILGILPSKAKGSESVNCSLDPPSITKHVIEKISGKLFIASGRQILAVRARCKSLMWPGEWLSLETGSAGDCQTLAFIIPCSITIGKRLRIHLECLTWSGQWHAFHCLDSIADA